MEYLYRSEYQALAPKCCGFKLIGRQISSRGEAAIDIEDMPGNEARLAVVQEEHGGAGNFVGRRVAALRDLLKPGSSVGFTLHRPYQRRLHRPRRDGVDPDILRRQL